jgi:hypothetical protein
MLLVFLNYTFGCRKTVKLNQDELNQDELSSPEEKIVQVVLASGDVITFNKKGGNISSEKPK